MAPRLGAAGLVLLSAAIAGCAVASSPASPSGVASSSDGSARYESELALCIDETNRLRASVDKPALSRSADLEVYAAAAARADGTARTPHQYALSTNHGHGLSAAENELLYWNLSFYKSVRNIIAQGLSQMWHQGEGASTTPT